MEVDVVAKRGMGSEALEEHLVHRNRLLEGGQVLLLELVLRFEEFLVCESLLDLT